MIYYKKCLTVEWLFNYNIGIIVEWLFNYFFNYKYNKESNMKDTEHISVSKCDCNCIHKDKLNVAKEYLGKLPSSDSLSNFFKNFADNTRVRILTILDKVGAMCVNDIAVALDMTKSAISHQLSSLKDSNLVKCEKQGKIVFYSLSDSHVKDIIDKGLEHIQEK